MGVRVWYIALVGFVNGCEKIRQIFPGIFYILFLFVPVVFLVECIMCDLCVCDKSTRVNIYYIKNDFMNKIQLRFESSRDSILINS